MSELEPCPGCHRHVAITETACPFCAAAQPASSPRRIAAGRMTRAAVFAGAALATAACGGKAKPVEQVSGSAAPDATPAAPADAAATPQVRPDHNMPMPYGAPPARRRTV